MQNDIAFQCSRCGEYKYETELAEQICNTCNSKPTNTQRVALTLIISEMEQLVGDGTGCPVITCATVAGWARRLSALSLIVIMFMFCSQERDTDIKKPPQQLPKSELDSASYIIGYKDGVEWAENEIKSRLVIGLKKTGE
jgi:hypothetical protein